MLFAQCVRYVREQDLFAAHKRKDAQTMSLPNTHFGYDAISDMIASHRRKIFFSGIGGISMNSLAKVCHARGHIVSGYDRTPSALTRSLEQIGISVYYNSSAELVDDCELFVYTVAMPADDPAYVRAGELGIPRISRADFLGYIMVGYSSRIGVSGMHGKSTTTALLSSIYSSAGLEPTVFGGAVIKEAGSSDILGGERAFIFEACEYMDSFLDFYPTTAVVLNIEMDHVDYFRSMEQIRGSFAAFLKKANTAVVNIGDSDVARALELSGTSAVTFGESDSGADYTAENVCFEHGYASFNIMHKGKLLCRAELRVPGHHMVTDALAAAAAAHSDGVDGAAIERGLSAYGGISRRMELVGHSAAGADIFDDYAHHPTELENTLEAAAELGYAGTVCVFQPHTFSRTAELLDGFARALGTSHVDEVILAPIYPAREVNTYGISSEKLCKAVKSYGKACRVIDTFDEISSYLTTSLKKGDAAFVIGAGDVTKVAHMTAL